MLLSENCSDESGLQVSLWQHLFHWSEPREHEASLSGVSVYPVHQCGNETGV